MAATVPSLKGGAFLPNISPPHLVPRAPTSPKAVRRLRHHSEVPTKEALPLAALPIWVGSATCEEVTVKSIKSIVSSDLHQHEDVMTIDEAEGDAPFCSAYSRFVEAAEHLEQAISVRQQLLGDEHEEFLRSIENYVVSCNNWSVQCLGKGDSTAALELLKKAEAMTEAENVPNYQRRVLLRAVTFNNLCCYYRSRGKQNAALQFAEQCLRIEQHYKEAENPARTYLNYAVLLSTTGRHSEALQQIEKALAVLHDKEREPEVLPETLQMLVVAHYNTFVERLRLKQSDTGIEALQKAVQVAKQKLGESSNLTQKIQEVQMELEKRLEQKVASERFRTSAGNFDVSQVFMHFQDSHAHPWRKVTLEEADADRAQEILSHSKQITLRRKRPVFEVPMPPDGPPSKARPRPKWQQQTAHSRMQVVRVPDRWWDSHPKLLNAEGGFAGSPILCQHAHGVQPMLDTFRSSPRSTVAGSTGGAGDTRRDRLGELKSPEGTLLAVSSRVPVPPAAPPEVVAAAEFHHRRLQLQGGVIALEPERMRAITVFRDRLEKRREKGLPTPTDYNQHQAATKIQARIRGYLVRQWTFEELAREMRRQRALEESPTEEGILDGKRRAAFRVIYAARRAFVEYSAAVRIQKVVRGAIARMQLQRQIGEIADQSAVKLQALARGRRARAALRKELAAATRIQAHARGMFARLQTQALQGDFRLMPQSEWQRIYGRFEATPSEAIAVRSVPKGDFRCMLPSAWDSIYARFKVAEAVLAEHQQLSSSQERIEADTNCQRPSTKQDGAAGEYVLFLTRSQLEVALAKEKQSSKAKVEDRPRSSQQGAAKEYVSFLTRAQLEAAVAKADDGPTLTVTSEKDDTAHHYVSFLTRSQLEAPLAQKQRIVASQDQDDAAHQYISLLTASKLEAELATEQAHASSKTKADAAHQYISLLTASKLEAELATEQAHASSKTKAEVAPSQQSVSTDKDSVAAQYVSFLTKSLLQAELAKEQVHSSSKTKDDAAHQYISLLTASKLEAELATEQVHASSKTKERMADGDFRTLPAAAWHCIHARFEVDRPDVTSPLHCLSVTSEALDAVATSTSKALVATSIEEMADAIDSPNVDRVHSPVTSPASPASQYVSFLTSLHLQETAEDDPLHPNSQASIASQHESPFTSVQLEASIGDDPHQASSYLEASPASQYVSFLTSLHLQEAAEDDPLHPNSQASIASQHESPFTSVQLEASIGDPHQVSSHLEASPSSQHNVDEDLRLQVSIDDPHVPSGELEDVSSSVVSPRVDITTHDLDAITVEDNMSSSTRRMDISQDTWRLATPMSQASEVQNLDASQDTGFLCKEVVDTAVFEGVRDLKPGTPEFHQEDTSLVVTALTFREEVDDAVLESILANALRVPPGCDSSEVGRPPERENESNASPMSGATVNDHEVATEVAPEVASLVLNNSLPRSTSKVNSEVSEVVDGSNVGEAAIARSVEEVVTSMQGPMSPQSPQWANSSLGIEDVGASVQGLDDAITDIHKEIEAMVPHQ